MYLIAFPLLLIPFAFFNMVLFLLNMPFSDTVFTIPLAAGRSMPVSTGDLIVAIGMLMLYVELVKAVRPGGKLIMDHVLSFLLFVGMVAELALVPQAATPTLLLLTVLSFVDVITGLSVRPAQQKIVIEGTQRQRPEVRRARGWCGLRAGSDRAGRPFCGVPLPQAR